jgi:arabinose-5-phosphate isomerase
VNTQEIAISTFQAEAASILHLQHLLTDDFDAVVRLIFNSKGRLIITGIGKSGLIGAKMAATFASTGTPSYFIHPVDAFHGDMGMMTKEDIVLAISYSGTTAELLRWIPYLNDRHIPIIAMTGNPDSLLAKHVNYHLNVAVEKEACPFNLVPTSSTTATLVMGDALAIALIHLRNFQKEDFARLHPGGSLGYRLLTKVKDVMRTQIPVVNPETEMGKTIITMSAGKLGLAVVLKNNHLLGIVTDGDVRRAMQKYQDNFFHIQVRDIMSATPKVISCNSKLIDAQELMQKYSIHALLVIDENEQLVGILDSFGIHG